jgi:hypothetical protein
MNHMTQPKNEFERAAGARPAGLVHEFWHFMRQQKKWWMAPIILLLLALGLVMMLSTTAAAPFIYTLF